MLLEIEEHIKDYKRLLVDNSPIGKINMTLPDNTKCIVYFDIDNEKIIEIINQDSPAFCKVCSKHHCCCLDKQIPHIEKALLHNNFLTMIALHFL